MAAAAAVTGSLLLTVGCSSSNSSSGSTGGNTGSGTNWATASSVSAGGGMTALVAAAKKEGTLNVITLPSNWANYGTIMKDFTAKYGIKINDANPDGSSQDEETAVDVLVRPEGLRLEVVENGNGIVTTRTFLGSVTRIGVQLSGDVAAQVDRPSTEAAALAPGASISVSLPAQPVLVAARRVS
jgi:putative spermidine/putrescine transport system substrate-binding protein